MHDLISKCIAFVFFSQIWHYHIRLDPHMIKGVCDSRPIIIVVQVFIEISVQHQHQTCSASFTITEGKKIWNKMYVVLKHLPLIDISLQNFSGWGRMKSAQDLLDLFMFAFLEHSWSIKIERVEVPRHPVVGGRADLVCPYILETDRKGQTESLYSVKWYKDGHEFYRQFILDKDLNPTRLFPLIKSISLFLDMFPRISPAHRSLTLPGSPQM